MQKKTERLLKMKIINVLLLLLLPFVLGANFNQTSLRINRTLKSLDQTLAGNNGANICIREEPYVDNISIPEMQPVRVRTSNWCLEIPPRCSTYKTEMREVIKVQLVNRTRTVRFCCDGYEGNLSDSNAICRPICRGGCGRGSCVTPETCSCEEGYTGKHCTQRCDHDRWGLGCKNLCQCENDAVCDNKTGICHCTAGWAGQFCEQPCPPGTHGIMCRKACNCTDKVCHPQTGDCVGSGLAARVLPNVTHVMFESLNSTIVNITHNLDHIARKIGTMPSHEPEVLSTPKAVPEVILIKQAEEPQHTPKIIVHQSSSELLENLHSVATASGKTPEVIHVITHWPANGTNPHDSHPQLNLAGLAAGVNLHNTDETKSSGDHDTNLLITLLLLIIVIGVTTILLYVYWRYNGNSLKENRNQESQANGHLSTTTANGSSALRINAPEVVLTEATLGKSFLKPLPELPRHQQQSQQQQQLQLQHQLQSGQRSNEVPQELYDSASKTPPYAYARKESLYSVVSPKSRKGSLDSHLYDEIRYHQQHGTHAYHLHPHPHQHHHHQHQHQHHEQQAPPPPQQPRRYQHATTAAAYLPPLPPPALPIKTIATEVQPPTGHHVAHLIIPPQNCKFLQVPAPVVAHKVAHI